MPRITFRLCLRLQKLVSCSLWRSHCTIRSISRRLCSRKVRMMSVRRPVPSPGSSLSSRLERAALLLSIGWVCPATVIENAIEQQFGQKAPSQNQHTHLPNARDSISGTNDGVAIIIDTNLMEGQSRTLSKRLLEMKRSSTFQPHNSPTPAPTRSPPSTQRPRSPLGSSTFLEHYEQKMRQNTSRTTQGPQHKQQQELSSSRVSVKSHQPLTKRSNPSHEVQESGPNQAYIDNLVRLKLEETNFRIKSRIATMLKEMGATPTELGRFSLLGRTEDLLDYLSEHIRDKLSSTQIREDFIQKERSKQKESMAEAEIQLEALQKKAEEREASEKELRKKLKESNSELKVLYEQVNVKEKELSQRITELYQTRTLLKEAEKHSQSLTAKYMSVEKERDGLREAASSDSKNTLHEQKALGEELSKLQEDNTELREELEMMRIREKSQSATVANLNEEVERWRQRFELQQNSSKKPPEEAPVLRMREKMQQMADEWRDKLAQLVDTYEQEKEENNQRLVKLVKENERLQQQVNSIPSPEPATMVKRERLGSFDGDLDLGELGRQVTN